MTLFVPDKPTAWITGAGGLIGSHLLSLAANENFPWKVVGWTRAMLDLADSQEVSNRFREQRPRVVIHCAALSRSPECQRSPALARELNVEVTRTLAALAADIPLVLLSTDLVFDGRKGNYQENDPVNPLSIYGETKVEAERILLANPRHLVVRTSLNAGRSPTGDRGLEEQMVAAWRRGEVTPLFTDEFRCPIAASVTAKAIWELVEKEATGLFHVAGAERLSRWQIGELLVGRHPEFRGLVRPASLRHYAGAPRSPDTSLNCARAQQYLSFSLPRFSDWMTKPQEL